MTSVLRKLLLPLGALLGLLLLIYWLAGGFRAQVEPGLEEAVPASAANAVPVQALREPAFEAVPASVEARETTVVASRLLARITALAVRSGDYVEAGDLLVSLEQADLEARARQAQETVRSVSARLKETRQNLARAEELHERNLIADADLDAARANASSLQAQLAGARQAVEEAEAALSYSRITSPIAGRIVDRFAEPGDTVQPGQKILSLYNPFSLRVEARVREGLALALVPGRELAVTVPAMEHAFTAQVEELVPAADPGSRTFEVKASLAAQNGLLPGMYARLLVPAGEREVLLLPADRVREVGQLDVLWIAGEGGPERRFVRLGPPRDDGQVEVLAGVAAGELVLPPPR
ncbi:efflux RND transporter periplasmic adaptor subunit [Pseudohaliea rubra]|uniref:Putative Co/Zn/Cd efflux system membrane fusion protein n=1 Tax=Pseudohaliea rubra DSM 19751 TaxID=1265313 RepID=A0A095XXR5_9GAMM|nr:efflux RND transporter periplasmic adaptor subunit [Pseudohaliea rubra]KGE04531.1 putative Co/Zn/Cd efflux system membrane fusion protein [Pseudohaliea rubra DSM 19751]